MTLVCVVAAGAIAALFILMATSLDPLQMMNAGAEPWTASLTWTAAFVGISIVAAGGLRLWHTKRFRPVALVLVAAELAFVAWAFGVIYTDYF